MTCPPIEVFNLRTGRRVEYRCCTPREAVVCADEQSRGNWNTWTYDFTKAVEGDLTVSCGDWTALRVERAVALLGKGTFDDCCEVEVKDLGATVEYVRPEAGE